MNIQNANIAIYKWRTLRDWKADQRSDLCTIKGERALCNLCQSPTFFDWIGLGKDLQNSHHMNELWSFSH